MGSKNLIALYTIMIVFILASFALQWFPIDLLQSGSPHLEIPQESDAPVSLSIWLWDDDAPISERIYEDFLRANPHVSLEFSIFHIRDYKQLLRAALASGQKIDIFNVDRAEQLSSMIEEGWLYPLNDMIREERFDTSIYGTQFDRIKYQGTAYALPYRFSVFSIAYNKNMFRERGVPFPHDHMTWDELAELAALMTFEQDGRHVYGINLINRIFDNFFMAFQDGRTLVDENLDLFARSLQFRVDLISSGVSISPDDYEGRFIRREFEQEAMAMYITADWTINQMRESYRNGDMHFDFDVVMLPSADGRRFGRSFGQQSFIAVSATSENPKEAFRLAAHYAGMPGARRFAEGGLLPGVIGNQEIVDLFIGDSTQAPVNIRAFVNQSTHLIMPVLPGIEALNDIFLEEAELAARMQKSVEAAMDAIRERRRELMKNYL